MWDLIVSVPDHCLSFYFTLPTSNTKCHIRFMLGSGTKIVGRFRLFSSVRYCILPSAVRCGAVHTFSHTLLGTLTFCEGPWDNLTLLQWYNLTQHKVMPLHDLFV